MGIIVSLVEDRLGFVVSGSDHLTDRTAYSRSSTPPTRFSQRDVLSSLSYFYTFASPGTDQVRSVSTVCRSVLFVEWPTTEVATTSLHSTLQHSLSRPLSDQPCANVHSQSLTTFRVDS